MDNVFCSKCKHVRKIKNCEGDYNYYCSKILKIVDTPIKRNFWVGDCYKLNELNDCKEYEEYIPVSIKDIIKGWFIK